MIVVVNDCMAENHPGGVQQGEGGEQGDPGLSVHLRSLSVQSHNGMLGG